MAEAMEEIREARPRRFRPYPEYSHSGVDWIGAIPRHWKTTRTKFAARLESGHTPSRQKPEYWENCTVPWFGLADVWQIRDGRKEYVVETNEKVSELGLAHSSARLLPKGTVILSRTASVGFSAILGTDMATTQDFVNWVCGSRLRAEYLLYVFRSMGQEFRRLTMGSTHQTIYMPDVNRFETPIPSLEEQERIVAFIRRETAKIDGLVARKERLLELLQEKRTALITRAVTQGLDPNVPMKDSGVEWLGKIPAHWRVVALKRIGRLKAGAGFPDAEQGLQDEELPFFKVGDMGVPDNQREMRTWQHAVSSDTARRLGAFVFPPGTIIFAKVGAALLLNRRRLLTVPSCLDNNMMGFMPAECDPDWALYWLSGLDMGELANPGAVPSVNEGQMSETPAVVPSVEEQRAIAVFLDGQTTQIEALVSEVRKAVDHLQEFRAALISAAVTGKIDVREEAG